MPFQDVRRTSAGATVEPIEFVVGNDIKILGVNLVNETNPCRVTLELVKQGSTEFGFGLLAGFPLGDDADLNDTCVFLFPKPFENKEKSNYLLKANFLNSTNLDSLLMRVWSE